jgi:hypothetical protein
LSNEQTITGAGLEETADCLKVSAFAGVHQTMQAGSKHMIGDMRKTYCPW